MLSERRRGGAAAAAVALVAFLPFARGALAGASLYFRDLSLYFFPLRRFALEGLQHGELRFWNPYVHEGVPLALPPIGYPLDLLALAWPHEPLLSLLLALHVPLGALFLLLLARRLGLGLEAACGGALVYALGGFYLSTVNLYVYVQAAAWAPLVVLGLLRVLGGGGPRSVATAALAVAVALSTTGVELVGQAILAGAWLGLRARRPGRAELGAIASLALGAALAAPVLATIAGQVEGSARGQGFAPEVVLAHSIHPFGLVQTLVGGLFGDLSNLANEWWGQNFFPRGFPYVLSLYLGTAVLSLALTGVVSGRPPARRLALLALLGLAVALGRWGVLAGLARHLGPLGTFRFPVKAFFTVHLAVALLAALGLQALAAGRHTRTLAALAGSGGALLLCAPLLPQLLPERLAAFARAFLPPGFPPELRADILGRVLSDAAVGGAVAVGVGGIAWLVARGKLGGARGAWLALALCTADLLRTGAGLNPMLPRAFFEPSPELASRLPQLREGRVFTCPIEASPAYLSGRLERGLHHEVWSFALLLETLSPSFNVPLGVATALSPDLTMLVPTERLLPAEPPPCRDLDSLVPLLREAAITNVLALEPLAHANLELVAVLTPARTNPVVVHVYRLRDPLPRLALAGPGSVREVTRRLDLVELATECQAPSTLLVRDGWAAGWAASVDGVAAPLPRGRHLLLTVPAGTHRVELRYNAPGLGRGLAAAAIGALLTLVLLRPRS